ncbi:MAG: class I SAM-dependent methyltransferase [Nitrospiraceae bacterium]
MTHDHTQAFTDPEAVARYADGPPRAVPGYYAMQSMTTLLLAERIAETGRVLVLGAGGGLELKTFAQAYQGWQFDGVDPSAEMLELARQTLGPLAARTHLRQGYIDDAPEGPFDGAACLLTLHFLDLAERRHTLTEVRRRLKPNAPFVMAHFSVPPDGQRALWLSRYSAFLVASGIEPEKAVKARQAIDAQVHILTSEQDETLLQEAGFSNVSMFYTGFTFRGWVAYA